MNNTNKYIPKQKSRKLKKIFMAGFLYLGIIEINKQVPQIINPQNTKSTRRDKFTFVHIGTG